MSDAKPYTMADTGYEWSARGLSVPRVVATVAALDAAQAEVTALRAEAKERQRVLEQAIEERASAFSERNWANERHEEAEADLAAIWRTLSEHGVSHGESVEGLREGLSVVTALRARVAEVEAKVETQRNKCEIHFGARVECGQCHDSRKAWVDDLQQQRDEWKAKAEAAAASAERLRAALVGMEDACSQVASWSAECIEYSDAVRVAARAALSAPAPAWLRERDRALAMRVAEAAVRDFRGDDFYPQQQKEMAAAIVDEVVP